MPNLSREIAGRLHRVDVGHNRTEADMAARLEASSDTIAILSGRSGTAAPSVILWRIRSVIEAHWRPVLQEYVNQLSGECQWS